MIRTASILLLSCLSVIAQTPPAPPIARIWNKSTNAPHPRIFTPQPQVIKIGPLVSTTNCQWCYIVQRSTNLSTGVWKDVAIFNNTNTPTNWTDPSPPAVAFYRGGVFPLNK